jgi:hypothetical protein
MRCGLSPCPPASAGSEIEGGAMIRSAIIAGIYEVIAAIALVITGIWIARDGPSAIVWGGLLILLGALILGFWLSGMEP